MKTEILGGATTAYDTLNELKSYIDSSDSSVSTALTTSIASKAVDTEVVHLTGAENITGIKTFTNGLTVSGGTITLPNSSIDSSAINNGTRFADLASTQTFSGLKTFSGGLTVSAGAITLPNNSISSSAINNTSFTDLASTQTITGHKILSRATFRTTGELITPLTVTSNAFSFNYSVHTSIISLTPSSTTNMTANLSTISTTANASYTITALINTSTNKAIISTVNVNGVARTIFFVNGASSIPSISSALRIMQTITIVNNASGVIDAVYSSVNPFYA